MQHCAGEPAFGASFCASLTARLARAESQLVSYRSLPLLAELAGQGERLCEECPSLQLRRRRAVLDAAINRVRVVARGSPSHRFQPARFKITWRL